MSVAVKERPILFSGPMVRAILDGRKTQTRRVARLPLFDAKAFRLDLAGRVEALVSREECIRVGIKEPITPGDHWRHVIEGAGQIATCPYGSPGDRLWVRETFREIEDPAATRAEITRITEDDDGERLRFVCDYRADNPTRIMDKIGKPGWRSSIHMPRRLSRITLEITDIRVERLQEITEADATAEGVVGIGDHLDGQAYDNAEREWCRWSKIVDPYATVVTARGMFAALWGQINGKRHPWDSNPWVWVIEFRRLKP